MQAVIDAPRTLTVDAVTATVEVDAASLAATLIAYWNGEARNCRPLRGMGYTHAAEVLCRSNMRRCIVQYSNHHAHPCVTAEGTEDYDAPGLYEALQKHYDGIWVPSRVDAALDIDHPDAFDWCASKLVAFALDRGITIDYRGDWERGKGRTLYLYSRTSQCYLRLYEYAQYHGYGPACRLEVEVKMKGRERRLMVAAHHPSAWLRMCPAAVELLGRLGGQVDALTVSPGPRAPTSNERDLAFLASVAWPALLRLIAAHDGDMGEALCAVARYRDESERTRALLRGATT